MLLMWACPMTGVYVLEGLLSLPCGYENVEIETKICKASANYHSEYKSKFSLIIYIKLCNQTCHTVFWYSTDLTVVTI